MLVRGTVAFDYPDIRRLARHLAGQLEGAPRTASAIAGPAGGLSVPDEPVAIVGMAGRLPGASDLGTFWSRIAAGTDLVTEGRLENLNGGDGERGGALRGGYVAGLDRFDAAFFRIPPVEAEVMDPQQRLLLETSWEALEDAALDPGALRGSRTGVYAGITNRDYEHFVTFTGSDPARSLYLSTGNGFAAAVGRVSFALGLQGPAIAVDTACSSSLVAIHQAVAALQRGEADLALAGGVNAILLPEVTQVSRAAGMLAPDGRCKTFDAAADGYVRGEGCGMLVLKRLSDAEREEDRILAVILGSAVNQDGASAGLTVPNGPAQEQVIREALSRARIAPAGVDYLEAHGTGTELGDPIEVQAAAAAYGEGREPDQPLLLGSVKTNIGHLEAAAGVAGVIKAVLALRHRRIPRHLHFQRPNPQVDWERLPVQVTNEGTPWPEVEGRPPRAAVSSFGYSGTNAHLILERYEPGDSRSGSRTPVAEPAARRARLLPLAAQTPKALGALAGKYLDWLREGPAERSAEHLADAAWTAGVGRRHFRERAGLPFTDAATLRERLTELASGAPLLEPRARAPETPVRAAFLFTGQGSQWPGMGRDLYEREPVVRAVLDRAESVFREERGASLLAVMFGRSGGRRGLDRTEWTQPALYALGAALAELWKSVGIEPQVVIGHSAGEIAAAHAAGVFGFEEGLRFAARRGAFMGSLPRRGRRAGGMLAVFATAETVASALREGAEADRPSLELAADNGSHQVVSGPVGLLEALDGRLGEEGIRSERLATSHAFHSALMDPVLDELEKAASELGASAPTIPLVTNVTGRVAASGELEDGAYWRRQARAPVRFAAGVATLAELGCGMLIEVGPRPVLGPLAAVSWPETAAEARVIASQRGAASQEDEAFLEAVARAYEGGLSVHFAGLCSGERRRRISLPSYPFERRRHWVRRRRPAPAGANPLLGVERELPSGETSFEIDAAALGWLTEHRVFGRAVAPAAFHGAQALEALSLAGGPGGTLVVSDMRLKGPLLVEGREGEPDGWNRVVQVVLGGAGAGGERSFEVFSRAAGEQSWLPHAVGRISRSEPPGDRGLSAAAVDDLKSAWSPVAAGDVYARFRSTGVEHGSSFQALTGLWVGDGEAAGALHFPPELSPGAARTVALDACLQVMEGLHASADPDLPGRDDAWLPVGWERLFLNKTLPERVFCRAWLRKVPENEGVSRALQVDLRFYADDGALLGGVSGLRLVRASRPARAGVEELLHRVEWRPSPSVRPADFLDGPDAVVRSSRAAGRRLAAEGMTVERMAGLDRGLETLAAGYTLRTLERLGWALRPGAVSDIAELRTGYGVADPFRRLFGRLFAILEEAGVVTCRDAGSGAAVVAGLAGLPDELRNPDELAEQLLRQHPEGSWEIRLLQRAGAALADVLRQRAHAAVVLTAGEGVIEDMPRDSRGQSAALGWMAGAVAALARKLPEGRRLRVLEVGAGPGAATGRVVPELPRGRTDYTVTDLLETYFEEQRRHFRDAGARMEFRVLDLERDPAEQGFDLHSYDLVLASNSLHPIRDLAESLGNMRRLLAPFGVVVVLEGVGRRAWMDLTFGVLEAWWRFDDKYRSDQAMPDPAAWERAFRDAGYAEMRFLDTGGDAGGTDPPGERPPGERPPGERPPGERPPGERKDGLSGFPIGRIGVTVQGVMVARGPTEIQPDPGVWVVGADAGSAEPAADLARELERRGQQVVTVAAGPETAGVTAPDPPSRRLWRDVFRGLPKTSVLQGVVHFGGLEEIPEDLSAREFARVATTNYEPVAALAAELSETERVPRLGVSFVTRGGQVVHNGKGGPPAGSLLWGLGRVLRRERRDLQVRLLDLDWGAPAAGLADELLAPGRETEVALRDGERLAPRLVRLPAPGAGDAEERQLIRRDGSYLVTGALEGIGWRAANWLAEAGARAIVAVNRQAPEGARAEAAARLRRAGVTVRVAVADITEPAAVTALIAQLADWGLPPLAGVVHAAPQLPSGVPAGPGLTTGGLPDAGAPDPEDDARGWTLAPPVVGAWNLHRATLDLDLDLFVLLSSVVGTLPNPGQGREAAASAFLDQFARWRRRRGLPGQAISWGALSVAPAGNSGVGNSGVGDSGDPPSAVEIPDLGWISPEQGAAAFHRLLRTDVEAAVVTSLDWSAVAGDAPPPLLEDLVSRPSSADPGPADGDLRARLAAAEPADRETLLARFLAGEVQALLGLSAAPADDAGFFELGMNSLMAVELRNRIRRAFPGEIAAPNTIVLDYPTIRRLAAFLAPQLGGPDRTMRALMQRPAVRAHDERIAIVGMACRLPGGADPEEFWSRLEAGADLVRNGRPDELMLGAEELEQAFAGYVAGMDLFDAEFFRIAPVEAELMDPQQRLLLETSWLALEDAGLEPGALRGSRTGVYAGIMSNDYGHILQQVQSDPARGAYIATGSGSAAAIGRVSFVLGLQGPAVAVDTACSSSLVAIHQAAAGLLRGESDLALAGGVNAILSAVTTKMCLAAGMLSPDGRCKTFDARANGIARGEGCGLVVLKRLEAAERDGDRILGVLLGSAVNQDGASAGFTVPNGPAQEQVIRDALDRAGVEPSSVDYLETHGTGTELGDPIEVQAAAAVYGEDRAPDRPLLLGSVKANVGHLEAAAGVAGVIKVLLAMRKGLIPKQLHFETPNPKLDWERLPVRVASEATSWPLDPDRPVRAGVSSFGYSGTNAHLILESYGEAGEASGPAVAVPVRGDDVQEAPDSGRAEFAERRVRVLPLSGRSGAALSALAGRYLEWLEEDGDWERLSDGAWTAGVGRSHFRQRAGAAFSDKKELREQLEALASGGVLEDAPRADAQRVAFLFTGQGSQWVGMGRDLYEREPVFREVLDRAEGVIREERGESLLSVLFGGAADLDGASWAQPAVFALQGGLVALWRSVGVEPAAVLGHSLGEVGAACAAGVFGFEEGLLFASRRGALLGSLPRSGRGSGGMLAVFAPLPEVMSAISEVNAGARGQLDLAAENGMHQVVSGPRGLLGKLSRRFEGLGVRVEPLSVSPAGHSLLVEPVLGGLEEAASELRFEAPVIPLVTGVTGRPAGAGEVEDGAYWRRQARSPVRFATGVESLASLGSRVLIELGPRGVLGPMAALSWPAGEGPSGGPVVVLSQGSAEAPGDRAFAEAVAGAYEAGLPVAFEGLYGGERRRRISVPAYPFQRERHWVRPQGRRAATGGHPLLGVRHELVTGGVAFQTELGSESPAWLADHRVFDLVIAPGALYAAQALAAGRFAGSAGAFRFVDGLEIESPLVLSGGESPVSEDQRLRAVQVVLEKADTAGAARFEVFSRDAEPGAWVRHAAGQVATGPSPAAGQAPVEPEAIREGLSEASADALYARLAEAGLHYGPSFRGIARLWVGTREVLAEMRRPAGLSREFGAFHPAFLDACLHVLAGVQREAPEPTDALWLPVGWERLWVREQFADRLLCHAALRRPEAADPSGLRTADLWFFDENGAELGGVKGFRVQRANRLALRSASSSVDDLLYRVGWFEFGSPGAGGLLSAAFLARPRAVARTNGEQPGAAEGERRRALGAGLERLAHSFALHAFDRLRWSRRPGAKVEPETLRRRLKVTEQHRSLFLRLLALLAEARVLDAAADGSGWRVGAASDDGLQGTLGDPETVAADLRAAHPEGSVEISLLARCGAALADVLRGRTDAFDLLFSGDPSVEDLYRNAPAHRAGNANVGRAVEELVPDLPEGRRLRILEVGAGTGVTTEAVLGALPANRTDYAFTDTASGFFAEAERRFRDYAGMDCRVLDIERDPREQGFRLHGYDVVVAASVLHATRDLASSLVHCRRLLAPSGVLLVLERVEPRSFLDLTFGLLPGWWRFDDAYRSDYPLVPPPVWKRALEDAGFAEPVVSDTDGETAVLVARGPAEVRPEPGTWVVWPAAGGSGTGAAVVRELRGRGQTVVTLDGKECAADPLSRESWRVLFGGLPASPPLAGVVHCGGVGGPGGEASAAELAAGVQSAVGSALALSQGLYDAEASPSLGVSFLTRGGQVLEGDRGGELAGSAVWGFGRAAALEFGALPVRLLDLDPRHEGVPRLVDELLFPDREPETAFRGDGRRVSRLVRLPASARSGPRPATVREDRSYLVTGGLRGIGLHVAGWLAAEGAGAVVLNGRRPPEGEAAATVAGLRAQGAEVRVEIADVADGEAVEAMLSRLAESGLPPLGGLFHSVGGLADRTIPNQDWESFARVLGPKVLGAWHLHRATLSLDLDLFVLFSSMVGVLGGPGQTNYAAANAFLDQLALFRRAQGLPGQAIAWGGWSGVGGAVEVRDRVEGRMEAVGAGWMTPEQGLAALARLVGDDVGASAVTAWDWERVRGAIPLFERLVRAERVRRAAPDLVERLRRTGAADRQKRLVAFLQEEVQSVLRLSSAPAPEVGFFDVGMDSLMAVEFRNRMNRALTGAYTAPNTLIFDHPTIAGLAAHLAEVLAPDGEAAPADAESGDAAAAEYERVRDLEADAFLSEAEAYLGTDGGD